MSGHSSLGSIFAGIWKGEIARGDEGLWKVTPCVTYKQARSKGGNFFLNQSDIYKLLLHINSI